MSFFHFHTSSASQRFGKKPSRRSATNIENKHQRMAREALTDLLIFDKLLDEEMQNMRGDGVDKTEHGMALYNKMQLVRDAFEDVLSGFPVNSDNTQRNQLISYADTVQDLMIHLLNTRRSHVNNLETLARRAWGSTHVRLQDSAVLMEARTISANPETLEEIAVFAPAMTR